MELPQVRSNKILIFPSGQININNCYVEDLFALFNMPRQYYLLEDEIMLFVLDQEYGELSIYVDSLNEAIVELHIEFFEDLDWESFRAKFLPAPPIRYVYIAYGQEIYVVFSKNFCARLSKDGKKVACLLFFRTDYIQACIGEFTESILQASEREGGLN